MVIPGAFDLLAEKFPAFVIQIIARSPLSPYYFDGRFIPWLALQQTPTLDAAVLARTSQSKPQLSLYQEEGVSYAFRYRF
jgi:hypothetical protein